AEIRRKPLDSQETLSFRGRPAVEFSLNRNENSDSLEAARILGAWVEDSRPLLPPGVELVPYSQQWELLQERINLLVKNGVGGLALVLLVLFLFLRGRVAFWIAVGIPVSFMAALGVLYAIGGSINMVSLFGMIMALGIIVDDAIVVGEEAMSQYQGGGEHDNASERAARRMLGPVFASSLTTIASFLPLILIGGIMGAILSAIPIVVVCIIVASLVECFLILPGHLTHSFRRTDPGRTGRVRRGLDNGFRFFRERLFRPTVKVAVGHSWTTLATAIAMLVITVGWLSSGRVAFQFFPTAEADRIYANVSFVSGTPAHVVEDYLLQVEQALYAAEEDLGQPFVKLVLLRQGAQEGDAPSRGRPRDQADHLGSLRGA
ncbi:MAG: efflux RND transporter permease subunit, partial [Gammaproteobacteria bacterium]|nr:efflux RND transporter permease subunit [Gammaproteobacteria bacterium]